ncbi:MAG: cyclic 2,3-diphosphoglycerate synthase [Elusimicrobia bacterium]|nr:cyclic 2,3-diphosphoglycerate synthase [Elusimicrobiota bacterium]
MKPKNIIIMGAAGRDFHNFNVCYRNNPQYKVVAFTAFQIPNIAGRKYPAVLAGEGYPDGIPIYPEEDIASLIKKFSVEKVIFAYSDVNFIDLMRKGSAVITAGAEFSMLGAGPTMIKSSKPVIAVCAVRTGCGKSQTSRKIASILKEMGKKVVVIRHPMPYGDLSKQICQRFASIEDMEKHGCTIEEMEEYEPHIKEGHIVYAGVDYGEILRQAEKEADVILWDGGNNDTSFYKPDLYITVADPHRPGHEEMYYPGLTNVLLADVVILNKVETAKQQDVELVKANVRRLNPSCKILEAESPVTFSDDKIDIKGKKVLVVEDGPTLTHGEMKYGAGYIAAKNHKAGEIVDPRPYAVGSIKAVYEKYKHVKDILPAMGYDKKQVRELEQTINAVPCDVVLIGTPIDLGRLLKINKPSVRVLYSLKERTPMLKELVNKVF